MRIFAIEKTKTELDLLCAEIKEAFPDAQCQGFLDPLLAVKSFTLDPPDFTVFSRSMKIVDGFMFTRMIRKIQPDFTGLMLDEEESWKKDAVNYALDFQVKPVNAEKIRLSWKKIRAHTRIS